MNKKYKKSKKFVYILFLTGVLILSIFITLIFLNLPKKTTLEIKSFQDCIGQGYITLESYPRQCRSSNGTLFIENLSLEEACSKLYQGDWVSEYKECENINKDQCNLLGGAFNECASACRHNTEEQFCILLCIPVCSLDTKI